MSTRPKTISFIINPFAGGRSKEDLPELINQQFLSDSFTTEIIKTKGPGDATRIAEDAVARGVDMVVAVGGDGTLNEVAKALIHTKVVMGIIPGGSGNGLAMHLGIGRKVVRAIEILKTGKIQTIDTAVVNNTPYINMAGIGIDGLVAFKTKKSNVRGFATYFKGAIWEGIKYKNQKYTVEIDGKEVEGKFLSVNVANGSMFGYNFYVAPDADTSDGFLDAILIHDAWKIDYFTNVWRFFTKRIHKSKFALLGKAKSVKITTYEDAFLHIDGEGFSKPAGMYEFKIVPASLRVIVPAD